MDHPVDLSAGPPTLALLKKVMATLRISVAGRAFVANDSSASSCECPDHGGRGHGTVARRCFLTQARFKRVEVEFAFRDHAQGDRSRVNRSKGFSNPLVVGRD